MAHCYRCGRYIEPTASYLRRKVRTGEWMRRNYLPRAAFLVSHRAGMRIVCTRCAKFLDRERARPDWKQLLELTIALAILLAFLISKLFNSQ